MTIRRKLASGFAVVSLLAGVVGYFCVVVGREALEQSICDSFVKLARLAMDNTDRALCDRIEQLQGFAEQLKTEPLLVESNRRFDALEDASSHIRRQDQAWVAWGQETLSPLMQEVMNNALSGKLNEQLRLEQFYRKRLHYLPYEEIFVTNRHGANVAQTGRTSDYYQADETWWQEAKEHGLYVGNVAYDESAKVYSKDIAVRIDDASGRFAGVMKAVLNVEAVIATLGDVTKEHVGTHFELITNEGKVIYSTKGTRFLADADEDLLARLRDGEDQAYHVLERAGGKGEKLVVLAHSRSHKGYGSLGWTLAVEHNAKEVLAPIARLSKRIVTLSAAVVLVALLLSLAISGAISRPLATLSAATVHIGRGNLDTRIEVTSRDEIGVLARSFNEMVSSLKEVTASRDVLNRETAMRRQREEELRRAHEELTKQVRELALAREAALNMMEDAEQARREAERSGKTLEKSEKKLQTISDSALDAVVMMDSTGNVVHWNPAAERMFGYSSEEIIGRSIHDALAPPRYREKARQGVEAFARSGQGAAVGKTLELEALRKDGSEFPIEISVSPIEVGGQWSAVAIVRDITKRKKDEQDLKDYASALESANESLQQANQAARAATRAKSEFLANMSHEIRTPMTAILGFTDVLLANLSRPEETDAAATVKRNGEYLLRIINDILDLSRIEAGKMIIQRRDYSPYEIVEEIVSLMRVRAEAKGLSLEARYEHPLPQTIHVDPVRLRQVLVNLVGNAIKFTQQGHVKVIVRFTQQPHASPRIHFAVADTGIGIAPNQVERMFEPFTQADTTAARRFGGSGLGLAISRRLAEALGGDIELQSRPGEGSTFTLTIDPGPLDGVPLLDTPPEAAAERAEPAHPKSTPALRGRVLLAEDGPDNQRLISLVLNKAGLEVDLAENGRAACEKALASQSQGRPYDLILMDIQMPELDGYQTTQRLRQKGWQGPIVALTAHAMAGDREKCLKAGCNDYASKPIERRKLLAMVARHLSTPEEKLLGADENTPVCSG